MTLSTENCKYEEILIRPNSTFDQNGAHIFETRGSEIHIRKPEK